MMLMWDEWCWQGDKCWRSMAKADKHSMKFLSLQVAISCKWIFLLLFFSALIAGIYLKQSVISIFFGCLHIHCIQFCIDNRHSKINKLGNWWRNFIMIKYSFQKPGFQLFFHVFDLLPGKGSSKVLENPNSPDLRVANNVVLYRTATVWFEPCLHQ